MAEKETISRRGFLKAGLAAVAASSFVARTASAEEPKLGNSSPTQNVIDIFKKYDGLTTQNTKEGEFFNPELLKGKVTIVATGYNGCPVCSRIGATLAATQKALESEENKIDAQFVVMSINPDEDRKELKGYEDKYKNLGMDTSNGKLHLLMAKNNDQANDIHTKNFGIRIKAREGEQEKSHTPRIFVYDASGKCLGSILAHKAGEEQNVAGAILAAVKGRGLE